MQAVEGLIDLQDGLWQQGSHGRNLLPQGLRGMGYLRSMQLSPELLMQLPPEQIRAAFPGFLASYIQGAPEIAAETMAHSAEILGASSDGQLKATLKAFAELGGGGYRPYNALPTIRELARGWMQRVMIPGAVEGTEHLLAARGKNQLWVGNHRSYIDTSATDALLAGAGLDYLADDMMVVAGPKVYSDTFRRVAAAGLNTLMVAQSTQIGHNAAELSPREVAAIALNSLKQSQVWRAERGPVLLYPEGTRTRSGRMGPFLRAAARYARNVDVIVPMAIIGSDDLFGLDEKIRPSKVTLRVGEPFEPPKGKTAWLEEAHARVAALLPEEMGPEGEVLK